MDEGDRLVNLDAGDDLMWGAPASTRAEWDAGIREELPDNAIPEVVVSSVTSAAYVGDRVWWRGVIPVPNHHDIDLQRRARPPASSPERRGPVVPGLEHLDWVNDDLLRLATELIRAAKVEAPTHNVFAERHWTLRASANSRRDSTQVDPLSPR